MYNKSVVLGLLAAASVSTAFAQTTGRTTRYWDCCKPSCSWSGKADVSAPVTTCDKNDRLLSSPSTRSGCDGGSAFTCSNMSPWVVSDNLSYGYAATAITGKTESDWCCACYQLQFTSGPVSGKKMIVQSTNTGGDLGSNHFDLLMPGGGVGLFDGCSAQFGHALPGAQYGGVSSRAQCDQMPENLKEGCYWRFDWFSNSDNPDITFSRVRCPSELTAKSGCVRNDDSSQPPPSI
ncbi:hypothetical protein DL762_006854 [Monosporascus cannonballus]|uniref:Cellulase n=1 Tax=Monosporascus cannonballus TaxID=155416 RepID=A0ABY0H0V8_9PEZI|nr:hypothetical protein DL762_006854 [Monosporascus cannonballus]